MGEKGFLFYCKESNNFKLKRIQTNLNLSKAAELCYNVATLIELRWAEPGSSFFITYFSII